MRIVTTLIITAISTSAFAQDWVEMIGQPDANFYEVQEAFNEYWEQTEGEGLGYKQYKRWEWFMEGRVNVDGNLPSSRHIFTELDKVKMQRQHRSGGAWEILGPIDVPQGADGMTGIGRITAISFHPTDSMTIYAGAPAGGLWVSNDAGESWVTHTDNLPNLGVSDLIVHPTNDSIMYLSSGDGSVSDTYSYGVLKSMDKGLTWDSTGLSFTVNQGVNIHDLAMDLANPDILLAATTNGIYRTLDGGETWSQEAAGTITDIDFKIGSSDILFATVTGSTGRIMRSMDAGDTWEVLGNGFPNGGPRRVRLGITPADPERIYALTSNGQSGFYGLYMSVDGGDNWTLQTNSPNLLGYSPVGDSPGGQAWYCMDLAVSKVDPNEIRVGGINMWISYNAGIDFMLNSHWTGNEASYVHADHHRYEYHPITNQFFAGCDGGIYKKATTWSGFDMISNGISATQFYRLSVSDNNPDMVTGGAQDNGTKRMIDGEWDKIFGGDGMETIISHSNDNEVFVTTQNGPFYRSVDGGNSFSGNLMPEGGPWVTSYIQDPFDANVLYCGTNRVYRSDNNGGSWFELSPNLTTQSSSAIRHVKVHYSDPEIVLANTNLRLWRTTNLATWNNISGSAPTNNMSSFAIDPYDSNKIWITYSSYSEGKQVYRTIDGGTTWENMSLNLPALPVNCITIEKSSTGGVYIGTDVGVYYIDESLDLWEQYMTGLPNVIVNELEIQDDHSQLVAATYGRGIWRSATRNVINVGIETQSSSKSELLISPNPTNGEFKITCSDEIQNIQLLDAYGKLLQEYKPKSNFVVATSNNLASGIYYLHATGLNGPILERLIISE
ncbi:MAG: photosystem II stability/assembly factor-like uncharacterized protein [Bacteroidia bacterium]|jgi:photosystem II stability/assembly factor-like uncharacterized protein